MPAFKKAVGRPPSLTKIHHHTADGKPVTVAEAIVEAIRAGAFIESAAAHAGVNRTTIHEWQRTGGRVLQALHNDGARRGDFTRKELACAEFSDAVARAYAEASTIDVATSAQLARGGLKETTQVTRTETGPGGVRTVTETRVKALAPDPAMIRWRLAKREASTWGREALEITGADGGPVELSLADRRAQVLDGLEALNLRLTAPDPDLLAITTPALPAVSDPEENPHE